MEELKYEKLKMPQNMLCGDCCFFLEDINLTGNKKCTINNNMSCVEEIDDKITRYYWKVVENNDVK